MSALQVHWLFVEYCSMPVIPLLCPEWPMARPSLTYIIKMAVHSSTSCE